MADFSTGIPNIRVIIREASDENLTAQVPNITVKLQEGAQYNVNMVPNTVSPLRTGSFNSYADLAGNAWTASYAIVAQTLLGSVQSASYATTASNVLGGTQDYIPLWASDTTLSSSRIFQTQSSILIGSTTQHTPEAPDTLGVFADANSTSYNLISAHGNVDSYLQLNLKNFNAGTSASSDIVATADIGTETSGYVDMGINSSNYINNGNGIGNALDAYLYVQNAGDLLIGNKSADKRVVIFTGEGDAINNARVYVDPSGSVGINTAAFDAIAPEALVVQAINSTTYNLIKAYASVDNYVQLNLQNTSNGTTASSDIVATADNGDETINYVDLGINGSSYGGVLGSANDAYLYSAGNNLYVGTVNPSKNVIFFVGNNNTSQGTKLTLRDNNTHDITGSLVFGNGGVTGSVFGTASWALNAITASYAVNAGAGAGFPFSGSAIITGSLLVSQSGVVVSGSLNVTQGITGSLLGTSSWANNAISSSFAVSSSRTVTSSYAINADLLDGLNSTVFATTGSNTFSGNQTITGSLLTNADTIIFTGSIFTSGSMVVTGSINVSSGITGSLFGTSSYALSASYVDGGLY
jgi:hypothetical protein